MIAPLRIGLILSLVSVWIGCLYFGWRNRPIRFGLLLCTAITVGFLICPGRSYESRILRNAYTKSLRSYEGTRYVWGGENKLGIDCSGLVRAGLIKASLNRGLVTLNPRLARYSLSLWWHDSSAKALGEEYRQQTKHILRATSINTVDKGKVSPGDLAVTANGVHVLAYLGNADWIEADPLAGKVIVVKVPAIKNPWFNEPVNIMRWTLLETK